MKTLIVYDSKHGFTEKCVQLMAQGHEKQVEYWPLQYNPGAPVWSDYHQIVLGGPVYFGKFSAKVGNFVKRYRDQLMERKLALFAVSLSGKASASDYISASLPADLLDHAHARACFGGAIQWKKLSWLERFILHRVRGITTDASNLDLPEIQNLAAKVFDQQKTNA